MLSKSPTFAQELKEARLAAQLTQRALADSLRISVVMVGRYEMGTANPSDKTLFAINSFFDQLADSNNTNKTPPSASLSNYNLDELLGEIRQRGFKVTIESTS